MDEEERWLKREEGKRDGERDMRDRNEVWKRNRWMKEGLRKTENNRGCEGVKKGETESERGSEGVKKGEAESERGSEGLPWLSQWEVKPILGL